MNSLLGLPSELLLLVVDFLDTSPPSQRYLLELPSDEFFTSTEQPLKALIQCCKLLHSLVVPILFQHITVNVDEPIGGLLHVIARHNVKNFNKSVLLCGTSFDESKNSEDEELSESQD